MGRKKLHLVFLLAGSLILVPAAIAQNNRSAVSVAGSDLATCTVADPCRTFAVALASTNAGGDIVALSSGGYGPFIIDKPVIVVAAPGVYAAVSATTGNAIEVNAGATAKVVIRGLHLYGMGPGTNGINIILSEEVHIENCVIHGFTDRGVRTVYNVRISDTTFRKCSVGVLISSPSGVIRGTIDRVNIRDCFDGMEVLINANVTVRDSVVADSSSVGFFVETNGQLNIENSLVTTSGTGIQTYFGGTARLSNTMVTANGTGLLNGTGSTLLSWGNNKVMGNTTDITGAITVVAQD